MRKSIIIAVCASTLALSGCENLTRDEQMLVGGLAGATVGVLTAQALNADRNWVLVAGLAGAAVGTLVARDQRNPDRCAYSRGDGTYYIAPCP